MALSNFIALLLLILSCATAAFETICLGQDDDSSNCTSFATSINSSTITQDDTLFLLMQDIVISESIKVKNRNDIAIFGDVEGIEIMCENRESGFTFIQVTNLTIINVTMINCGALHYSTSYGVNPDIPELFRSSIYMINCTDVTIARTHITKSGGTGLAMFDCTGAVHIYDSSFTLNQVNNESYSGGGGVYIEFSECGGPSERFITCNTASNTHNSYSNYTIEGCIFSENNKSFIYRSISSSVPYRYNFIGHGGGGLAVWFLGDSHSNNVMIKDTTFFNNIARYGGGLNIRFQQLSHSNDVCIHNVSFTDNTATRGGGGLDMGFHFMSTDRPQNNIITVYNSTFDSNTALFGGGSAYYTILSYKRELKNNIHFENCIWKKNKAPFGSAKSIVTLSTTSTINYFAPVITFTDCHFMNNEIVPNSETGNPESSVGVGALYIKALTVKVVSTIQFTSNVGTALSLVDGTLIVMENTCASFDYNTGNNGGAVSMVGFSSLELSSYTTMNFTNNYAFYKGGAIYTYSIDNQLSKYFGSCFINFRYDTVHNVSFYFSNNTSEYPNSNSIYTSSILPCTRLCDNTNESEYENTGGVLTNCPSVKFVFHNSTIDKQVATETSSFYVNSTEFVRPFPIIPGKQFHLPFTARDEFGYEVNEPLYATLLSRSDTSLRLIDSYTANNKLLIHGRPFSKGQLNLVTIYFRNLSFTMDIEVSQCPPGFINVNGTCTCASQIEEDHYYAIQFCNEKTFVSDIYSGFWAGYLSDTENVTEDYLVTSICPFEYCGGTAYQGNINPSLPSTASSTELDIVMCGQKNRTGILCGRCIENNSVYYHSWEYKCGNNDYCEFGALFYILSDILPITVVFVLITFGKLNFNTGLFNGFILFAQLVDSLAIEANGSILYSATERHFRQVLYFIYSPFNLDFFKIEPLSFCIFKGANYFAIVAVEVVSLLYGIALVVSLVYIMRTGCCYKLQIACFKSGLTSSSSLTRGLSAFIILCYSKCTRLCFQILNVGWLRGKGTIAIPPARVFCMGDLEYFTGLHILFALSAIVGLATIVILPPLILIVYPLCYRVLPERIQQKFPLHYLLSRIARFKPLLDTFQGFYRCEHQYFAGLYFAYRTVFLVAFAFIRRNSIFLILSQSLLTLMLALHLWIQPYVRTAHNAIDGGLFLILSLANAMTFYRYFLSSNSSTRNRHNTAIIGYVQIGLLLLPVVIAICCFIIVIIKKISTWCKGDALVDHANSNEVKVHQSNELYEQSTSTGTGYSLYTSDDGWRDDNTDESRLALKELFDSDI